MRHSRTLIFDVLCRVIKVFEQMTKISDNVGTRVTMQNVGSVVCSFLMSK